MSCCQLCDRKSSYRGVCVDCDGAISLCHECMHAVGLNGKPFRSDQICEGCLVHRDDEAYERADAEEATDGNSSCRSCGGVVERVRKCAQCREEICDECHLENGCWRY